MTRPSWGSFKLRFIWLAPTALLLLSARLAVLVVPFRFIIHHSGAQHSNNAVLLLPSQKRQLEKARHSRKVIARARQCLPIEINCFPQAVTAIFLLRLRKVPYSLFFGVRRDGDDFNAHAWVSCGHITVCGDNGQSEFKIISTYTYEPEISSRHGPDELPR